MTVSLRAGDPIVVDVALGEVGADPGDDAFLVPPQDAHDCQDTRHSPHTSLRLQSAPAYAAGGARSNRAQDPPPRAERTDKGKGGFWRELYATMPGPGAGRAWRRGWLAERGDGPAQWRPSRQR